MLLLLLLLMLLLQWLMMTQRITKHWMNLCRDFCFYYKFCALRLFKWHTSSNSEWSNWNEWTNKQNNMRCTFEPMPRSCDHVSVWEPQVNSNLSGHHSSIHVHIHGRLHINRCDMWSLFDGLEIVSSEMFDTEKNDYLYFCYGRNDENKPTISAFEQK